MVIRLEYVYKDNCGLCEYFKPHFEKIVSEHNWEHKYVYAPENVEYVTDKGVQLTPTILVYKNDNYRGMIQGVVRAQTIIDYINSL